MERSEKGALAPFMLVASALVGALSLLGLIIIPVMTEPVADMRIEPREQMLAMGDTFTMFLVVESKVPVNVFAGEILFDTNILSVDSIEYNSSVADLWAERPWYDSGAGTLNFGGGTTKPGGFIGVDTLLTITFKTIHDGNGSVSLREPRILLHNGLGIDAAVKAPIDAVLTVENKTIDANLIQRSSVGASYNVVHEKPSADLNGDGRQSIADMSMLLIHLNSTDKRYDLNQDGEVGIADVSILLNAK